MKKFITALTVLITSAICAHAADNVIIIPDIEITETKESGETINRDDMVRDSAKDLTEALQYTPGVIITGGGARNDSNFKLRGFGADSVPIYVDGIEIANPFRGEGDSARILTGDLESITVQKGYTSMMLGANNLGGAVIMRIAKPKKPFEAMADLSYDFDSIFKYASSTYVTSVGTKQKSFYTKVVYQYRDTDHFRLSSDFEPTANNPQQKGERMWSDFIDRKLTLMAGVTPNDKLDLWVTYIDQDSDKRMSPPETVTRDYLIWDWPRWERESYSLNGKYSGNKLNIEALVYYDKYDNRMVQYNNMSAYQVGIHEKPSDYDEYTLGGSLIIGYIINDKNSVKAAVTYKQNDHKGLKGGEEEIHVNEDIWSVGAEYTVSPIKPLTLVAGVGFDLLSPQEYSGDDFAQKIGSKYYIVKTDQMRVYTWQIGAFYEISDDHEVRLTYARKNHFPTMFQRYSTRFGDRLPNPSLGPEIANHLELGYKGTILSGLNINTSIYYSRIKDKIVDVEIPNPEYPVASVDYGRNLDETSLYGFELGGKYYLNEYLGGGGSFSYNKYSIGKDSTGEVNKLTYYPEVIGNVFAEIRVMKNTSIMPRIEYVGSRYADSEGFDKLDPYTLVHLKITTDINEYLRVSAGVSNIFDKEYEIMENYPMAGRAYFMSLTAKF